MLPRLQRLVDAQAPCLASVYDEHFDCLVWNEPYAVVRHDPGTLPASRRNMLWMMFTDPVNRARMARWEWPSGRAQPVPRRGRATCRRPRFTDLWRRSVRKARCSGTGGPNIPSATSGSR